MAQVVLSAVGSAVGGPVGATVGNILGAELDRAALAALQPPRQRGPRLEALKLQGTAEGAPMPCVFGRARVTGQIIWAARFRESRKTSSGGKGGPRTVEYGYSLSFAIALGEGEIDGVGRVWADGQPMDLGGVAMRVHRGGADQTPDPLIEAIEGQAPAYRGTAYVVFEDLPLAPFGNRVPQLAFEVFRRPRGAEPGLEDRLRGVCLIPGAGEFVLATQPVRRREGLTRTTPENMHIDGRADLLVSLDQLQAQCPNLQRVSLVIGWFGDDVRARHCRIRPGVERRDKPTEPLTWSVAGLGREEAHLISAAGGGPAYGGTPSDDSVREAVVELKARGLEVTLYPFVFMDVAAGNGLPDPEGGVEQQPYPWRGRVRGRDGAEAQADVAALFGSADGWGLRRLALHYAQLASEAGADGLLIGSEMRGLTQTRDAAGDFPAVAAFRDLAAECRSVVGPHVKLSYAADWSEYSGFRGDGEVRFHLDPLWADPNVDYVAIDWYPPLGDWRVGAGGLDAEVYAGPDDPVYLSAQIAGGEGFDWFYASDEDRALQARSPILDQSDGEHWIYRPKDLAGWWGNLHFDRRGGVRDLSPTAWITGMKPVRLSEFGCAAVDRGGNAPNLFLDPKSAESALPPFSTGERDDRMQRRVLEAILSHFEDHNPVSAVYGGPMLEAADAWCWDARAWPAFPGRREIWSDAAAWRTGHWLNGRLGGGSRGLIEALLRRGGLTPDEFEIGALAGEIDGYVVDRPMRTRDALEPLLAGLGLTATERNGRVAVVGPGPVDLAIDPEGLASPDARAPVIAERALDLAPGTGRVRFIDGDRDYQTGAVAARQAGEGGVIDLDLPAVCSSSTARAVASRILRSGRSNRLIVHPAPLDQLRLEPGDRVRLGDDGDPWMVARIDADETPSAVLEPHIPPATAEETPDPAAPRAPTAFGAPFLRILDLPVLPGREDDARPLAVVAAEPWRPTEVWAGPAADALTLRGEVVRSATVGVLSTDLAPGPRHRWDMAAAVVVRLEGLAPQSASVRAVLNGANGLAVGGGDSWELLQFTTAELIGQDIWRLAGLLRGQQGSQAAGAPAGTIVVMLDEAPARLRLAPAERGLPLVWRAGDVGRASYRTASVDGVSNRPWSPAHCRAARRADGGFDLSWVARDRRDGDRWEGDTHGADPLRFRLRVLDAGAEVRTLEVEGQAYAYDPAMVVADLPGGAGEIAFTVAQWGDDWGWGAESIAREV